MTAQHNILTTHSEMTKVHLNQIWEKLKDPNREKKVRLIKCVIPYLTFDANLIRTHTRHILSESPFQMLQENISILQGVIPYFVHQGAIKILRKQSTRLRPEEIWDVRQFFVLISHGMTHTYYISQTFCYWFHSISVALT